MRHLFLSVAATWMIFCVPTMAHAGCGTDSWQGGLNQYWEYGVNWSLGYAPLPCDDVLIPDPNKGDAIYAEAGAFGGKTYQINSLQIGFGYPGELQIDPGSQVQIAEDLILAPGGITNNNGSLVVNGTGTLDAKATIVGSGNYLFEHDLYNNASLNPSSITVAGTLHNYQAVNVLRGGFVSTMTLDNFGTAGNSLGPIGTFWVGSGIPHYNGYYQYANGTLEEEITSAQFYGVIIADKASVGGTLDVVLDNGYIPPIGSIFEVVSGFSVRGRFGKLQGKYFNNGTEMWDVLYSSTSVELEAVKAAAATPEPTTVSLVVAGLAGVGALRRRRALRSCRDRRTRPSELVPSAPQWLC